MLAYVSEQGNVLTNSCGVVNLDADVDQSHHKSLEHLIITLVSPVLESTV